MHCFSFCLYSKEKVKDFLNDQFWEGKTLMKISSTKFISKIMRSTMRTSGPETLSISANIFVGQTEAPIIFRPFIKDMSNSELMAIMTGGFATTAGSVLALYVLWLE